MKQKELNRENSQISSRLMCKRCNKKPCYPGFDLCVDCYDKLRKEKLLEGMKENPEGYMKLWGFPKRFLKYGRESLLPRFQKILDDILQKPTQGLFITGAIGSGKTCFLCVLAKELVKQGKEIHFVNVSELLFEIKSTFDKEHKILNDYGLISKYANMELLILDDLGSEKMSEYVRQSLYVLVNKRYLNELITFFTSNLSLEEVALKIDERIASRIVDMCTVLNFGEKDLRVIRKKSEMGNI